jgi:iron complex transport system substrate-binding protein
MTGGHLSRRKLLAFASALPFLPETSHAAEPTIATIDWGLLEAALAIGAGPVAATELLQFRKIAVEPAVPSTVADLGLRGSPSFELLRVIKPDLILISGFYEYQRPSLERIAQVLTLPVYEAGKPPYPLAQHSTLALGERLGRSTQARDYLEQTEHDLAHARSALAKVAHHPFFVISLGDSRHFRAFGADAMFGNVLTRLGLGNGWQEATNYSAAAPVGIEALVQAPEAFIVIVGPLPPGVSRGLDENALWNALPSVREGRVVFLDPINHFGTLPSARRFARLLAAGIESLPHG